MDCGVHIGPGDVVLDKYRVERVLGIGGMGLIVAARHLVLDELFAIKLMLPSFAADREAQERFLREARAAARLKGDHVAKVQDVGCLPDGTSYMVMEYLEGEDLKKIVRRNGAFPIEDAVEYTLQTCKALREAHSLGIVHRDIKPANLMLVSLPDGAPRVKVIDFGISKHTAAVSEGLTTSSWAGGSPLYMPPEQVRSARTVDARADVWSVGAVLYELLTGVTPFHASSVAAVLQRVLNEDPVPPCVLRDSLSTALGAVVMRCLAKRPEDRFQSIDEVVEALRDAFPAAAGPPEPREPRGPPVRQAVSRPARRRRDRDGGPTCVVVERRRFQPGRERASGGARRGAVADPAGPSGRGRRGGGHGVCLRGRGPVAALRPRHDIHPRSSGRRWRGRPPGDPRPAAAAAAAPGRRGPARRLHPPDGGHRADDRHPGRRLAGQHPQDRAGRKSSEIRGAAGPPAGARRPAQEEGEAAVLTCCPRSGRDRRIQPFIREARR
jgi:hypothetical protein